MEEKIQAEFKSAMFAKDVNKKLAIGALKTAISNKKSEKGRPNSTDITDDEILALVQKQIKQRKESIEIYKSQNRPDLYEPELYEVTVLEAFLPQQMSEDDVRVILTRIVSESGATSVKEMGKVMGLAKNELAGKADNSLISSIIKELLA